MCAVEELVRGGVAVNFQDMTGDSALHWAAFNGNAKMVATRVTGREGGRKEREEGREGGASCVGALSL